MTWALVLAAGQGSRLASATGGMAKQFLEWEGAPLYWRSALVFSRCARIHGIVFVFPEDCLERERARVEALTQARPLGIRWKAVAGGKRRQDSVRLGLAALPAGCGTVLVHDAARPFLSAGLVNRILDGLSEEGCAACVPGLPVVDTIKVVEGGRVRVSQADCPDQVCVNQGWISDGTVPIVCLPNQLIVQIEGGGNQLDAQTG